MGKKRRRYFQPRPTFWENMGTALAQAMGTTLGAAGAAGVYKLIDPESQQREHQIKLGLANTKAQEELQKMTLEAEQAMREGDRDHAAALQTEMLQAQGDIAELNRMDQNAWKVLEYEWKEKKQYPHEIKKEEVKGVYGLKKAQIKAAGKGGGLGNKGQLTNIDKQISIFQEQLDNYLNEGNTESANRLQKSIETLINVRSVLATGQVPVGDEGLLGGGYKGKPSKPEGMNLKDWQKEIRNLTRKKLDPGVDEDAIDAEIKWIQEEEVPKFKAGKTTPTKDILQVRAQEIFEDLKLANKEPMEAYQSLKNFQMADRNDEYVIYEMMQALAKKYGIEVE